MTRSRSFGPVAGFVILSMALTTFVSTAAIAAGTGRTTHALKGGMCAKQKQNTPTGTIKFSDWQFPDTLNPPQTSLAVSAEVLDGMFDANGGPALWIYSNKAKLIPDIALNVPTPQNGQVKNGGKTIYVRIKKGLHWSNGKEITSADIKFGWQIGMDKASGGACSGTCDFITRIDTPDKYTSVWHLKQAYAAAIPNAAPPIWPTQWQASAGGWPKGDAAAAANQIYQNTGFNFENPSYPTNGAYQVSQFVNNDRIVLKPMKYYNQNTCGASLKQVIFSFYSSSPGMLAAGASGQTDVTQNYTVSDLPELNKHKSKHFIVHVDPAFIFEHMEFMVDPTYQGKPNPLSNTKVRLALALALDKYGLIQSALGVNRKTAQSIAAWSPQVNTPQLRGPFAPTKLVGQWDPLANKGKGAFVIPGTRSAVSDAKKLLAQTPFAGGFTLDAYTTVGRPVRQAAASVIQGNWQSRLNVKITWTYGPVSKLFAEYAKGGTFDTGNFQVAMFAFLGSPDPDYLKFDLESKYIDRFAAVKNSTTNGNYSGIKDKIVDRGFEQGARSYSKAVRTKAYGAAFTELNKTVPWIGLYFRPSICTDNGKVKNFSNNPTAEGCEWNMFSWKSLHA